MSAELTLDLLARRGEIRIGFQRHTPPFSFAVDEDFEPIGYSVDLAQYVVEQLALTCKCPLSILPVETTSATREAMLLAGEFDIECGSTTITDIRRQRVQFSRPIFCTGHRLALRREISASSSRALRITGITDSTSHLALLREPIAGLYFEFEGRPSIGEAFHAYQNDLDIDGLIADETILFGLLGQAGDVDTLVHTHRLGSEQYGFMLRQSDRDLLEAVDCALEKSLGSAQFVQHLSRWLTPVPC
jgi:glutamate/aspartate transport system substrate-binding protein